MVRHYNEKPDVCKIRMRGGGRSFQRNSAQELGVVIEELYAAKAALYRCDGIGTELYCERLDKLIEKYEAVKKAIEFIS